MDLEFLNKNNKTQALIKPFEPMTLSLTEEIIRFIAAFFPFVETLDGEFCACGGC